MSRILPECMRCDFFEPQDDLIGECRRRSPSPIPASGLDLGDADAMMALWPTVAQDDWCGEFEEASRNRSVRNASLTKSSLEDAQARLARRPALEEDFDALEDTDPAAPAEGEDKTDES